MGRIYNGDYRIKVFFEWEGETVWSYTDRMTYEDCAQMCLGFAIGGGFLHGITEVRPIRAMIEEIRT